MTVSLRIFFIGGLTAYRGLINWLSPWIFFPTLVIAPIFQILLFVYIGRNAGVQSDEFYVIGNAVQYASIPCLFAMTQAISGERSQQTLTYILVMPVGWLSLFLDHTLPIIANTMFAITSRDRKSTRLNSSHQIISYAVFCLKKKKNKLKYIKITVIDQLFDSFNNNIKFISAH